MLFFGCFLLLPFGVSTFNENINDIFMHTSVLLTLIMNTKLNFEKTRVNTNVEKTYVFWKWKIIKKKQQFSKNCFSLNHCNNQNRQNKMYTKGSVSELEKE